MPCMLHMQHYAMRQDVYEFYCYLLLATESFCSCAADFLNVLLDNLLRLV